MPTRKRSYNPEPLWLARRKRGLTQQELADSLGLDRITIYRAERASPSVRPETLQKICQSLSVPFEAIRYREKILTKM